jgi:hypothetical protein
MDSFKLDLGLKQQKISIFFKFCYFMIQQDIANIQGDSRIVSDLFRESPCIKNVNQRSVPCASMYHAFK